MIKSDSFDIILKPLCYEDIEMIRKWRNSPQINRYALDRKHITKKQQEEWFKKLGEDEYFIIQAKQEPIGLIWFNHKEGLIETGFYIYKQSRQNSLLPYKVVAMFHDYLFNTKQFKSITCKIQKDNKRAIRFNGSLGYKKQSEDDEFDRYMLSKQEYHKADKKIKILLKAKI